MELLIWILVAYGITNGVVNSKLADPIRSWFLMKKYTTTDEKVVVQKRTLSKTDKVLYKIGEMLICVMCFAFWVGIILHFWYSPTGYLILDAFLSSGTCWLIHGLNYSLMLRYGRV